MVSASSETRSMLKSVLQSALETPSRFKPSCSTYLLEALNMAGIEFNAEAIEQNWSPSGLLNLLSQQLQMDESLVREWTSPVEFVLSSDVEIHSSTSDFQMSELKILSHWKRNADWPKFDRLTNSQFGERIRQLIDFRREQIGCRRNLQKSTQEPLILAPEMPRFQFQ